MSGLKNMRESQVPLKATPNMYIYIDTFRAKNGKQYRYLVLEEYLGNGKRKKLMRIRLEELIKILLCYKYGDWCGGWDSNPRRPTPAGLKPEATASPPRKNRMNLEHDIPLYMIPNAPKLNRFMEFCLRTASRDVCNQYVRHLSKPLNPNNRWSVTAWKKYLKMLCLEGDNEACEINNRIKSKKSNPDLYVPSFLEVKEALYRAEEPYRTVYWILIQSGLRLNEATYLLSNIDRLKIVDKGGFKRVELGLERGTKRTFWGFLIQIPVKTVITPDAVSEYARKMNLLRPKYVRKFVSTKMIELGIPSDVVDFIQGRTPKKVLARNYLNLIALADSYYLKYAEWLKSFLDKFI